MANKSTYWKIFEAVKANGAEIGSASVNIIEKVIDEDARLAALELVAEAAQAVCDTPVNFGSKEFHAVRAALSITLEALTAAGRVQMDTGT